MNSATGWSSSMGITWTARDRSQTNNEGCLYANIAPLGSDVIHAGPIDANGYRGPADHGDYGGSAAQALLNPLGGV